MNSVTQIVCAFAGVTNYRPIEPNINEIQFLKSLEKIKKRYGNLGNVIRVKVNRTNNNMGIALAGHRNRHEMGCFIAGLNPKGSASSQNLKVGDEILEVI